MAAGKAKYTISPLQFDDFPGWLPLWDKNNLGQRDQDVTSETWSRLMNDDYPVFGFKAEINGTVAAIMHYILHPVTGHMQPACYMQDLFVDENYRRSGIGKALVRTLEKRGRQEKWARIYWLAENDNQSAQALYKDLGLKLDFSLHILPI